MQISTKGRHAVRIMADIAKHESSFVPISEISVRQEISIKYSEKIISMLIKNSLLISARGASGGYKLAKDSNKISVLEILEAVGDGTKIANCKCGKTCPRVSKCETIGVWETLTLLINNYLNSVTLKDLITKSTKI